MNGKEPSTMLVSSLTSMVTSIFHCIILVYKLSTFNWRNLKYLDDENYDLESNDSRNVLSRCRLTLLDLPQIICQIVPYVQDFVPFKVFFTLKTFASTYRKMSREMTRVKNC